MNKLFFTEKENVFGFLIKVCVTYTVSMVSMVVLALTVGELAKPVSSMFQLGSQGISLVIMTEFFILSVIITGIRVVLSSGNIFKKIPDYLRTVLVVFSAGIVMAVAIICFGWFPVSMWQAWVAFLLCYALCILLSVGVMLIKNKVDNKNYEEGLKRYLEEQEKMKR